MLCPTRGFLPAVLLTTTFLVLAPQAEGSGPDAGADSKPALLDVLLPADAELRVEGHKTRSTGEVRQLESPPLPVGKTCVYSLEATWHGHTVSRTVRLRPGQLKTVDFRQELRAMASATTTGSFSLLAPPALTVQGEQKVTLSLRVKRSSLKDPIRITFGGVPRGLQIPDATIEEDQSEKSVLVTSGADVPEGAYMILMRASGGSAKDFSTLELTVSGPERVASSKPQRELPALAEKIASPGPEKKPEKKPETVAGNRPKQKPDTKPGTSPPTTAAKPSPLSVAVMPAELILRPGQTTYVEVTVAGERGQPLPAEPGIALGGSPTGLTWEKWTASDFMKSPEAYTAGFALKASEEIKPGNRSVKVVAAAGTLKSECSLAVTIKRPELSKPTEEPPDSKSAPTLTLQLEVPSGIEVRQGKTVYAELTVKTADGSPLPEAPSVTLECAPEARLCSSPWTSSFQAGQSSCTVGLAITAKPDAASGTREVRLRAAAGGGTAQRTLKVTVSPTPSASRASP